MTAQIAAHGRLGGDPVQRTAKSGTAWATASIAVQLGNGDDNEAPAQWFALVAFGRTAETLARHAKGDLISVSGRLQLNRDKDREGSDREQLQVIADTVMSAKSVRPAGGRRRNGEAGE
jgi:single stranded DNA-binding protein